MGLMLHSEMPSPKRVLHSWKEIANYTGRGVRTVQRYELQYGFPVRRPAGGPRSAVLALCGEIDEWLAKSPTREHFAAQPADENGNALAASICARISSTSEQSGSMKLRADAMIQRLEKTKMLCGRLSATWQHTIELRAKLAAHSTKPCRAAAARSDSSRN